jgi:hypothetical protein
VGLLTGTVSLNGFPVRFIQQTIYSGNLDVMFVFLIKYYYWIFKGARGGAIG